jgi:hypothetical protein
LRLALIAHVRLRLRARHAIDRPGGDALPLWLRLLEINCGRNGCRGKTSALFFQLTTLALDSLSLGLKSTLAFFSLSLLFFLSLPLLFRATALFLFGTQPCLLLCEPSGFLFFGTTTRFAFCALSLRRFLGEPGLFF